MMPWRMVVCEQRQLQWLMRDMVADNLGRHGQCTRYAAQMRVVGCGAGGAVERVLGMVPLAHRLLDDASVALGMSPVSAGELFERVAPTRLVTI